jgi:hypothetical protein
MTDPTDLDLFLDQMRFADFVQACRRPKLSEADITVLAYRYGLSRRRHKTHSSEDGGDEKGGPC